MSAAQKLWSALCISIILSIFILIGGLKTHPVPHGNVLQFFDLGPQMLPGYNASLGPTSITVISVCWRILTIVGVLGSTLLVYYLLFTIVKLSHQPLLGSAKEHKWLLILILSTAFIYFVPIGADLWLDRYLIIFFPLLLMLVSMSTSSPKHFNVATSIILLLFYGGFTISATHDYLASN